MASSVDELPPMTRSQYHVQMLVKIIAKLPPSAETELEDEDYDPNRPAKDSFEV
jgi:hypothetical protein